MEISVSYAVIYMDAKSGKFLIVHPTHETYWSLPKGGMEEADGGDGAKAATRELFEEPAINGDKSSPRGAEIRRPPRLLQSRQKRQNEKQRPLHIPVRNGRGDENLRNDLRLDGTQRPRRALPRKRRFQIHRIRRNRQILPHRRRKSAESGDAGAGDWGIAAKTGYSKTRRYARAASAPYRRAEVISTQRAFYRDSVNLRG